jgi:hypothetical protein
MTSTWAKTRHSVDWSYSQSGGLNCPLQKEEKERKKERGMVGERESSMEAESVGGYGRWRGEKKEKGRQGAISPRVVASPHSFAKKPPLFSFLPSFTRGNQLELLLRRQWLWR